MKLSDLKWKIGIVDEDVDGGQLLARGLYHGGNLSVIPDIGLVEHAMAAGVVNLRQHFFSCATILEIIDNNASAALGYDSLKVSKPCEGGRRINRKSSAELPQNLFRAA